jgi:hypothetical protein
MDHAQLTVLSPVVKDELLGFTWRAHHRSSVSTAFVRIGVFDSVTRAGGACLALLSLSLHDVMNGGWSVLFNDLNILLLLFFLDFKSAGHGGLRSGQRGSFHVHHGQAVLLLLGEAVLEGV